MLTLIANGVEVVLLSIENVCLVGAKEYNSNILCTLISFNNACSRVHNIIIYDILHMESKCNSVEVLSFKEINTLQDTSIFYPLAAK